MRENRALLRPRYWQAMHHVVQGDRIEATHIEDDRLQHVGPIDFRVVAHDAPGGARETVDVQLPTPTSR